VFGTRRPACCVPGFTSPSVKACERGFQRRKCRDQYACRLDRLRGAQRKAVAALDRVGNCRPREMNSITALRHRAGDQDAENPLAEGEDLFAGCRARESTIPSSTPTTEDKQHAGRPARRQGLPPGSALPLADWLALENTEFGSVTAAPFGVTKMARDLIGTVPLLMPAWILTDSRRRFADLVSHGRLAT